ncbi:hypothetical protein [Bordetella sp. BOR01]|uniref:hypothetical protein n=1 Tax=Bordetella sp. BOR01 TaxID=2854779 RepID=UPI001C47CCE1|nr:hypothetical protein [Bordetella sp. BOR01]MBV7482446.1 hypothetical protein [Bordetella sp. BOR01]
MKTLQHYVPPSPQALRSLQDALGYSNAQMAQLAGLDDAADWSAFTAQPTPHRLGRQRLFYLAARLALEPAQWRMVLARMRTIGARFNDHDDAPPPPLSGAGRPRPLAGHAAMRETKLGMTLVSLGGAFHEMEQLREFAHFADDYGVSQFVASASYDSGADTCRFTLKDTQHLTPVQKDRIFEAAAKTIAQFEFEGRIYHGGLPTEPD